MDFENEIRALRIIGSCGKHTQLTHQANVLVSHEAKSLLAAGLIQYAPEKWVAYKLTSAGRKRAEV